MMDWVIEELRYKAKLFEDTGAVTVYTGHVVKSDSVVPESLELELQAAVAKLEAHDVPVSEKPKKTYGTYRPQKLPISTLSAPYQQTYASIITVSFF